MNKKVKETLRGKKVSRRSLLKGAALAAAAAALPAAGAEAAVWDAFFQKHFQELNARDLDRIITRLEKEYADRYGKHIDVTANKPLPGVLFGYGLDIARCIGCRRCV